MTTGHRQGGHRSSSHVQPPAGGLWSKGIHELRQPDDEIDPTVQTVSRSIKASGDCHFGVLRRIAEKNGPNVNIDGAKTGNDMVPQRRVLLPLRFSNCRRRPH